MWALIEDGKVIEVTDVDPEGRYHSSLTWYPCPVDTEQGWIFDGEVVRDYTVEEKELIKAAAVRAKRDKQLVEWAAVRDLTRDKLELSLPVKYDLTTVLLHVEALRNVPQQEGFPWTIDWPIEPVEL